jgi:hypothetical protein
MTARRAALVLAFAAVALVLPFVPAPPDVRATCGEPSADISDLFSISPPAPNLTLQGEAPFQVVITFADKTVESGPLTMSVSWGDGAVGQVTIVPCGDEVYSFPAQQLSHTFTSPGTYPVQWHMNSPFIGQIAGGHRDGYGGGHAGARYPDSCSHGNAPARGTNVRSGNADSLGGRYHQFDHCHARGRSLADSLTHADGHPNHRSAGDSNPHADDSPHDSRGGCRHSISLCAGP